MSTLFLRKLNIFFSQKRAWVGVVIFLFLFISSFLAELISNDKPLLLIIKGEQQERSRVFFPIFFHYLPEELGIKDAFVIDYKSYVKEKHNTIYFFPVNSWNPEEQTENVLSPPSKIHFMGTDNLGRDIFARLVYGVRTSLLFSILLWLASYTIGVSIGAAQGYFFGIFDFCVERFKELAALIPILTMVILITAITKQQSFSIILFIVLLFAWMGISSQIRASVLTLSKREFCEAAKAMGASHQRIIFKHILTNSLTPIITLSPFAIEGGISLLAALDYLGFGLPPPTPSIGEMMAQGRDHVQNAPWVLTFPILIMLLLLISINLIGQALRDAFDPKSA